MYNYRGFKMIEEVDYEEDNIKRFHFVTTPDGRKVIMDWSSYSTPTEKNFQLWVDLGMPNRDHPSLGKRQYYCPLDENDLIKIKTDTMSLLLIGV